MKDKKLLPVGERYLVHSILTMDVSYCDKFIFIIDSKGYLKQIRQKDLVSNYFFDQT